MGRPEGWDLTSYQSGVSVRCECARRGRGVVSGAEGCGSAPESMEDLGDFFSTKIHIS